MIQNGGHGQRWRTSGRGGYITRATYGVSNVSERGGKTEVAHPWAQWLHNPCRLGGPQRFKAGDKIRNGSKVAHVAT